MDHKNANNHEEKNVPKKFEFLFIPSPSTPTYRSSPTVTKEFLICGGEGDNPRDCIVFRQVSSIYIFPTKKLHFAPPQLHNL